MKNLKKYYRQIAGLIIINVIIFAGFQNCSPAAGFKSESEATQSADLAQSSQSVSAADELSLTAAQDRWPRWLRNRVKRAPTAAPVSAPVVRTPTVQAPVVARTPTVQAPAAQTSPQQQTPPDVQQASGGDCQSELAIAEWNSPGKFQDIKISEIAYLGSLVGQQSFPSSNGFKLAFKGVKTSVNNTPNPLSDIPSGFEIKFTNTSNSFFIAPNEYITHFDPNHRVSVNGVLSNTTTLHTNRYNRIAFNQITTASGTVLPGRTEFEFIITRDVYDRNSGLGEVNVELFCKGSLVASKVVNFASDENSVIFKSTYEKTPFNSTYQFSASGKDLYYFEKRFDGWIQPFCPATAKPGETVTCTVEMDKISSFVWSHLPDRVSSTPGDLKNPTITFKAPAAGSRYVGITGTTADGRTVYGSLYIKVK